MQYKEETDRFDSDAGGKLLPDIFQSIGKQLPVLRGYDALHGRAEHLYVVFLEHTTFIQLHSWKTAASQILLLMIILRFWHY